MSAMALALVSFSFMIAFVLTWQVLIRRVRIGSGQSKLHILVGLSSLFAIGTFVRTPDTLAAVLAGTSLLVCGIFVFLSSLAGQSKQMPSVTVGEPIPVFSALDQDGTPFSFASLRGHPVLIKFFRGHW